MRVLHLSTHDTVGGASRAAYRLHKGLQSQGVDSRMVVQQKSSADESVYGPEGLTGKFRSLARKGLERLPLLLHLGRDGAMFSPAWLPERRSEQVSRHEPDIVHLHWINGGFVQPATISDWDVPTVWTLHDMWPFTGGCHYADSCTKYKSRCEACPHLNSTRSDDLAFDVWERKRQAWDGLEMVVVTPSQWLAEEAQASRLLGEKQIENIPNGVNLDEFKPRNRSEGLRRFNLAEDRYYILFGAASGSSRKGADLFHDALTHLSGRTDITILTFGSSGVQRGSVPVPVRQFGHLSDEALKLMYSTADVTVVPSREDNLPNIAVESVASGTPCVAFDVGGLPEIIDHNQTGYLAEPFDPEDLARGITRILAKQDRNEGVGQEVRDFASRQFSLETVATQYRDLYAEVSQSG